MATALETASLVMVPSGYEDGTLGSLQPLDGTGDFTFTRGSNISATRVNEDGYIEKGYENLLLYSNSFNTNWIEAGVTVEAGYDGYDGSSDAWLLTKLAATSKRIEQNISGSGVTTFSVYLKADTLNWALLNVQGVYQYFDLQNGVLGDTNGSSSLIVDFGMQPVGNGWYRCFVTTNQTYSVVRIYPSEPNTTGSTAGSIYIQDTQLNQGLVAYQYLQTTATTAKGGILENMPRLDYSSGRCSLLLEPSRTNLIVHSEYVTGTQGTSTFNAITSPEGVNNGLLFVENTATTTHCFSRGATIPTNANAVDYTISIFAKKKEREYIQFTFFAEGTSINSSGFNLINGTTSGDSATHKIEDYGNGWYRCSFTASVLQSTGAYNFSRVQTGINEFSFYYQGDGTSGMYFYGFQVEQGSYPTSYIPTYGVSQTRLKDVFDTNADLSTYFGNGQGTFYFEFADQPFKYLTNNETINIGLRDGDYQLGLLGRDTSQFFSFTNFPTTNRFINNVTGGIAVARKYLLKWNGSEFRCYVNGEFQFEFSYSVDFQPNNFGRYGNGYSNTYGELFSEMLFFPTALSDEVCIELTTI